MNFLPDWPVLAAFSAAAIFLSITPGPDMTLFIARTLNQGRLMGLMSLLGASTGTVVHTVFAVAGVSAILVATPSAFWAIKMVGALYLLWLAFQAIWHGSSFQPASGGRVSGLMRSYVTGIGINILNPKVILFFMTFLPQFVDAADPHAPAKMLFMGLFFTVLITPLMVGLILVADLFSKTLMNNPKLSRGIDYAFGTVFGLFAIKILLTEGR